MRVGAAFMMRFMALMLLAMKAGLAEHPAIIPIRGAKVIAFTRDLLDQSMPLAAASWSEVSSFALPMVRWMSKLVAQYQPFDASQFVGYTGTADVPNSIIMKKNGLAFGNYN